jgi:phage I-like protein
VFKLAIFRNKSSRKKGCFFNAVEIAQGDFIKVVPIGVFPNHPDGPHEITATHLQQMADNFNNSKKDLLFDFEHRSLFGDTRAAGWSASAEVLEDGLYVKYPDFTPHATEMVKNREYRYLSPAYVLESRNKLGMPIGAQLLHVALTNEPYLDNEIDHIRNSNHEDDMKFSAEFLKKLGLPEDATPEQVEAAVEKLNAAPDPEKPEDKPHPEGEKKKEEWEVRLEAIENREKEREESRVNEAVEALVNSAINAGKITPAQKEIYINSAKQNFAKTKEVLDNIKANAAKPGSLETPQAQEKPVKKNHAKDAAEELRLKWQQRGLDAKYYENRN